MNTLKPNEQRAKYTILLIWVVLGLEILSFISSYMELDLLQRATSGSGVTIEEADLNDSREMAIGIIHMTFFVISAITFLLWFTRAYSNLKIKIKYLGHNNKTIVGSWFIPFVHFYRPLQIMKEMFSETKDVLSKKGLITPEQLNLSILTVWWTMWIITTSLNQLLFRLSSKAESIDAMKYITIGDIVVSILGIPLALITIKMIKDYSKVEGLLQYLKDDETAPPIEDALESA